MSDEKLVSPAGIELPESPENANNRKIGGLRTTDVRPQSGKSSDTRDTDVVPSTCLSAKLLSQLLPLLNIVLHSFPCRWLLITDRYLII